MLASCFVMKTDMLTNLRAFLVCSVLRPRPCALEVSLDPKALHAQAMVLVIGIHLRVVKHLHACWCAHALPALLGLTARCKLLRYAHPPVVCIHCITDAIIVID